MSTRFTKKNPHPSKSVTNSQVPIDRSSVAVDNRSMKTVVSNRKGTDMNPSEQYEALCARAARMYAAGEDTTEIDAECDALQTQLEKVKA